MSLHFLNAGRKPAKSHDKLYGETEGKKFSLSYCRDEQKASEKSYESKSLFFCLGFFAGAVHTQGISFQVLILLRLPQRTTRDEKTTRKTTSEIREQIKYFINYLYFQ